MKSFLLYLTLVGVPLLGLLMILRIGEQLEAPPHVGGTWTVDPSTALALQQSCTPLSASDDDLELSISQSGRYVQFRFNDEEELTMSGRIHAGTLTARIVLEAGAWVRNGCGPTTIAVLRLKVQRLPGGGDQLEGSWALPDCGECMPTPIVAVRPDDPALSASRQDLY